MNVDEFAWSDAGLTLKARLVSWDTEVFGVPVAQITHIEAAGAPAAIPGFTAFWTWAERQQLAIISCRLPEMLLDTSIVLESHGFRFIEMVLHPTFTDLSPWARTVDTLTVEQATVDDLELIERLAGRIFNHERYQVDPRVDHHRADSRYLRWFQNSVTHATQRLSKVMDGSTCVGLFVTENQDGHVGWHLTAIPPESQGRGYGRRVWRTMLGHHQRHGANQVTTTISARNIRVLNLYSSLGARFLPPEMTFHWVRPRS